MSSVLDSAPPQFTAEEAAHIAADLFAVDGSASALGSERDQAFLLENAVLKISNTSEDEAVLDLEEAAIAHVCAVDPDLPIARPLEPRATFGGHQVRLFERMHGRKAGPELADDAVREIAAVHARLCLALRSFFHPAAGRELLWNLRATPQLRPLLEEIADPARRALVARTLDRYEERVLPQWERLRGQVVHGDFNLDNLLVDERGRITGILDFGDCCYTALAADLAVSLASILRGRPLDDALRVARIALDGFAERCPLEPLELELLGDLVAARLAAIVSISAWRGRRFPENAAYIEAWDDDSWRLLELLDGLAPEELARELGAPPGPAPTPALARRRGDALGALLTPLTYTRPVHAARAEGVWIYEPDGTRLLDAYNNVPVVGHCHPRVTEAVVRQTRLGATNARYLAEPLVEFAERLLATFPPEAGLDTVLLVNSGSEANDLAWRLAAESTGHAGALVTENAYHGVTAATTRLSPEDWPAGLLPAHVIRIPPPGSGADLAAALEKVDEPLAATFLDGSLMSDGIHVPDASEIRLLVERTHALGGLYVADEVQAGHGRLGPRALVVHAPRHRTGRRHARQADGQRLPRCRGRDAARARRAVPVRGPHVLDLRRQPGRRQRRSGRARRPRGRAAARAGGERRRAPAHGDRGAGQDGRRRRARPRSSRRCPALERRARRAGRRRAAGAGNPRRAHRDARRRTEDSAAARVHG